MERLPNVERVPASVRHSFAPNQLHVKVDRRVIFILWQSSSIDKIITNTLEKYIYSAEQQSLMVVSSEVVVLCFGSQVIAGRGPERRD
jgi:hypothetical protein